MSTCEVCGNDYDKTFSVQMDGSSHEFDCFECAIHALAPICPHCQMRVIGHGVEAGGMVFCCAHCARSVGKFGLRDRSHERPSAESTISP